MVVCVEIGDVYVVENMLVLVVFVSGIFDVVDCDGVDLDIVGFDVLEYDVLVFEMCVFDMMVFDDVILSGDCLGVVDDGLDVEVMNLWEVVLVVQLFWILVLIECDVYDECGELIF